MIRTGILKFIAILIFGVVLYLTTGFSREKGQQLIDSANYFANPVGKGADPWVIKDGAYYYTCSSMNPKNGKNAILVSKSKSLIQPGAKKVVWTAVTGWNSNCVWAPELHKIGDKWYIYYAAGKAGPPYIHQRAGVLESETNDPMGNYVDKGIMNTGSDEKDESGMIWAIDLTVGQIGKQWYAIWSGWEVNSHTDKTSQHLYIAKMSNPYTISSARVKISSPVERWETGGSLDLNEGPQLLQHNGNVFIIYSTRESWMPAYRLGQLRLKTGSDPMQAQNWIKSGPVFQGNNQVFGVGHASFTKSPDGTEDWIFYHSKVSTKPGWERNLRLQPFTWDANGNPVFGSPIAEGIKLKKPSGEK